jgi:biopolymer transport protein ExbD
MAATSFDNDADNPIAINVTPLVDIIFCLCVFFMISFKFKQVEGKFDVWLPKYPGSSGAPAPDSRASLRIALSWNDEAQVTTCSFGSRRIADDGALRELLRDAVDDARSVGAPQPAVVIDADARAPWRDVVRVIDLCRGEHLEALEFALAAPPVSK